MRREVSDFQCMVGLCAAKESEVVLTEVGSCAHGRWNMEVVPSVVCKVRLTRCLGEYSGARHTPSRSTVE